MKTFLPIIAILIFSFYSSGQVVNVQLDHGATPDNNSDNDYTAISNAIAACQGLSNPILVFPEGTYHITSENNYTPYFPIDGIDNLTIQGQGSGAEIEFTGFNYDRHVFKFTNCKDLLVENLKIDYTEPPFTQGEITGNGSGWMRIKVEEGFHDIDPNNKPHVRAYALYDNVTEQQISNIEYLNNSTPNPNWADWYWVDKSARIMNVNYDTSYNYPIGGHILIRHKMYDGYSFLTSEGCENVTYKNITVYIAPGYPFTSEKGPKNISYINCRIEKKPGHWMTSTVDGAHLLDVRGDITFDNCMFENMGDDGINLHSYFLYPFQQESSKQLIVGNTDKGWYNDAGWKVGDKCEFFNSNKQSVGFATIDNIERLHYSGVNNQMRLTFKENIPNLSGELWKYSLSNISLIGKLTVKGTTIRDNRARGIILSSSDVIIENSTFERTPFPAIKFEVSNSWRESTPARNVIIRNNTFDDTNFVPVANYPGAITFKIDKITTTSNACDVFKNIRITGNTIKNNSSPLVYAKHVQNLEVTDNTFENTTGDGNLIQFGESQNVVINNNTNGVEDDMGDNCSPTTEVSDVTLDLKSLELNADDNYRLSATVSPFTADIVWSSDNDDVAIVDQNGVVTAINAGEATITAMINDGESVYTDTCTVTTIGYSLGVNKIQESVFKVFPNPVKNYLTITVGKDYNNATANIIDLSGRILVSKQLNSDNNTLNLDTLSDGVYMLQLKENDKLIEIHKILKQ